ncbi:hypothetical protein KJ708_12375 [bacterium]|nr:hypothetical protein [bacterium]MBU1917765.1 hypothetical protein [bacterium]
MENQIRSRDFNELVTNMENLIDGEKKGAKKRNIAFLVSGTLVLVALIYITVFSATYLGPRLILDYVQVKGVSQLTEINSTLKSAAPKIIGKWSETLSVNMPEMFRQKMMLAMVPAIDGFATKFSTDLKLELARLYRTETFKDLLAGKINVKDGYKQMFNQMNYSYTREITDFYADKVTAVHNLKDDLLHLQNSKKLTPKEEYAKKVIGAWLALLDHKGANWEAPIK